MAEIEQDFEKVQILHELLESSSAARVRALMQHRRELMQARLKAWETLPVSCRRPEFSKRYWRGCEWLSTGCRARVQPEQRRSSDIYQKYSSGEHCYLTVLHAPPPDELRDRTR